MKLFNEEHKPVNANGIEIHFERAVPAKHMQSGGGMLPNSWESAALWQFLTCAMQALHTVESQATLEGDEDQTVSLMQLATSIQMQYQVPLEAMFGTALIETAKREAKRCKMSWDSRLDAFFASGGKSYNNLTRDPDKISS